MSERSTWYAHMAGLLCRHCAKSTADTGRRRACLTPRTDVDWRGLMASEGRLGRGAFPQLRVLSTGLGIGSGRPVPDIVSEVEYVVMPHVVPVSVLLLVSSHVKHPEVSIEEVIWDVVFCQKLFWYPVERLVPVGVRLARQYSFRLAGYFR